MFLRFIKLSFFIVLVSQLLFIGLALPAMAEDVQFQPQVEIGPEFPTNKPITVPHNTGLLADYIKAIYNWGIGAVGIVAALGIIIGGLIWLTAGGNMSKVGEAKTWISSSLLGLLLALGAYSVLKTINPDLVNLKITRIAVVNGPDLPEFQNRPYKENIIGCCADKNMPRCADTLKNDCNGDFYPNYKCNETGEKCEIKTEEEMACAGKKQYDPCTTEDINKGYCDNSPNENPLSNKKFYGTFNGWCQPCETNGMICKSNTMCCSGYCTTGIIRRCENPPENTSNSTNNNLIDCYYVDNITYITYCKHITSEECELQKGEPCKYGCEGYGENYKCIIGPAQD